MNNILYAARSQTLQHIIYRVGVLTLKTPWYKDIFRLIWSFFIGQISRTDHLYSLKLLSLLFYLNSLGISKLSSSLTRKLQIVKTSSKQSEKQSITEEDAVSTTGYDSARSSVSQTDSIVNDRDTFYSVTSDSESDHVQRYICRYCRFLKSCSQFFQNYFSKLTY